MKITAQAYRLPVIEALQLHKVMSSGTTAPLLVTGVDQETGQKGDFVVKPMGATRMSTAAATKELVGSWMASQLSIPCPAPCTVSVSAAFVECCRGKDGYTSVSKSVGVNFGSQYLPAVVQVNTPEDLKDSELKDLARILLFDLLIDNPDRVNPTVAKAGKPNLMKYLGQCMVLDHEIAFAYTDLLAFMQNMTPWHLNDQDDELLSKHLLLPIVRSRMVDFEQLADELLVYNTTFWEAVSSNLPEYHDAGTISKIKDRTSQIVEHRQRFCSSINEKLYQ